MGQKTSFYITDELNRTMKKYVEKYGSVSKAINYAFSCLDTMYRIERKFFREYFANNEINYLVNKLESFNCIPRATVNNIYDFVENDLTNEFDLYEINQYNILQKIKKLTISQQYALIDWILELKNSNDNINK